MMFADQQLDGSEFKNCSLSNAVFDDVNLSGARLTNVNLSGLTIENANIKGLKIFGYDVEGWIREQLRKDGCHPDRAAAPRISTIEGAAALLLHRHRLRQIPRLVHVRPPRHRGVVRQQLQGHDMQDR